jgi:hypothetical protein
MVKNHSVSYFNQAGHTVAPWPLAVVRLLHTPGLLTASFRPQWQEHNTALGTVCYSRVSSLIHTHCE